MAKRKIHQNHNLQRFFIIFGVIVSLTALAVIIYSSQKPTNTRSDASVRYGCWFDPLLDIRSIKGSDSNYVTYTINIKNRDRVSPNSDKSVCEPDTYNLSTDLPNNKWNDKITDMDGNLIDKKITIKQQQDKNFKVRVTRPVGAKPGTHWIKLTAVNDKNSNQNDSVSFGYTVEGSTNAINNPSENKDKTLNCKTLPNLDVRSKSIIVNNYCDEPQRYKITVKANGLPEISYSIAGKRDTPFIDTIDKGKQYLFEIHAINTEYAFEGGKATVKVVNVNNENLTKSVTFDY